MNKGAFLFEHYAYDDARGVLRLQYRFEKGEAFEEQIIFPRPAKPPSPQIRSALERSFRLIFLLAGVSYYKTYVPEHLKCLAFPLDTATAQFIEKVYRQGLGEFSYKNNLDLSDRVKFQVDTDNFEPALSLVLDHHLLVPVGGGKDSIVTLECLKGAQQPVTLFGLGGTSSLAAPIASTMAISGLPSLSVQRTLSPLLTIANQTGAYNGHVPITAILSAIAVACALLHGMDSIVLSNEHSASAPNLRYNEIDINHQYSKSFAFEQDFQSYLQHHISPQLNYFSFLRPLTEAAIAKRFSRHEKYFDVFRSCNTAFRQDTTQRPKNWCCDCPKCRFVFLALAPFLAPEKLISIFGKNLLDDLTQEQGYAELCGLSSFKPFECVGEIEESALLLQHLYHDAVWTKSHLVQKLGAQLAINNPQFKPSYDRLFLLNPDHALSQSILDILHACS